jgi:flavodoxin
VLTNKKGVVIVSSLEIYYFSGTGNSLHVARELQERIEGTKLIPIVSLLNREVIETNAETIGFVFPIYMTAIPIPVKNFIKKLDLKSAEYIFAAATRIGTTHSAFINIDRILKRKGKKLNAYFSLNMPSNDPKFDYKVPTAEEIIKLEGTVHERLDTIQSIIKNKENSREKDINCTSRPFCTAAFTAGDSYRQSQRQLILRFKMQRVWNMRKGLPVTQDKDGR